ncbi:hypothetical protein VNO77_42457 [Canavalia gladiata]|uniref:Uncharacterized protein n=1 Tax=Canavalia gladiata TaxID=3824 RepID=A0AAN9JSB2_CANGL
MVAISLYRGNLHRVPDVPRRWLMPNPKISLKDFKSLLARRSKALSRLHATTTISSNPNPTHLSNDSQPQPPKVITNHGEGPSSTAQAEAQEPEEEHRKEAQLVAVTSVKTPVDGSDSFLDSKNDALERKESDGAEKQTEPVTDNMDLLNEKEKRKKEVEDKLQVLNAKKHNLVLVLKQILNAEEELKRRSSMQGVAMRGPSVPLQGDGTNDTGSMTRHIAPMRIGSEGNLGGDVDGGETDDFANHAMHSRHVFRTSSMSPSSESPLRRTPTVQQNMVSHPSRANLGATVSPSRFALSGHQGNPMNLPSVSVSGTSYIASSPSPAASGGTSVFRDARQPSPWK